MEKFCCVPACQNNQKSTKSAQAKFYLFPADNMYHRERRKMWIAAVTEACKFENWRPSAHSVLCDNHFIDRVKCLEPHHPAFIPTVFPEPNLINVASQTDNIEPIIVVKEEMTSYISNRYMEKGKCVCDAEVQNALLAKSKTRQSEPTHRCTEGYCFQCSVIKYIKSNKDVFNEIIEISD